MKRGSFIKAIGIAVGLSVFLSFASFAGEWQQDTTGWWYSEDDGSFPMNQWQEIDGKQYYFNEKGYMLSDTTTPDGYKVGADGAWGQDGVTQNNEVETINQTLVEDLQLTFGELKNKYGEDFTQSAGNISAGDYGDTDYLHKGTEIQFANSPLPNVYEVDPHSMDAILNIEPNFKGRYVFWETMEQLNDSSKVYTVMSSDTFNGFPEECSVDYFEKAIRKLGATNINIVDKTVHYKIYSRRGTENKTYHPVLIRFVYKDCWFYITGLHYNSISTVYTMEKNRIAIYPNKNEYEETHMTDEYLGKPLYEGTLMG